MDGHLCDVTLVAEGLHFQCHRVVLASASAYFRSMFTSNMIEKDKEYIELKDISSDGFDSILKFIYTNSIVLSSRNIQYILHAATMLQVEPVIKFCCQYLEEEISIGNCVEIKNLARFFSLKEVEDAVQNHILTNFAKFVHTEEFLRLPVEDLCGILSSDSLWGQSELELFKASDKWLQHDLPNRSQYIRQVMNNIRFPLIAPDDLDEKVENVDYMKGECMELLLEACNYHMLPWKQPIITSPRTRVRGSAPCLLALGGKESTNMVSKEIQVYHKALGDWVKLSEMESPAYCHCLVVLNDYLFVVGGQEIFDNNGNTATNSVFRFNPRFDKWDRMESMRDTRTDFHVSVLNGCLYAIGGRNNRGPLSSAEKYRVDKNKWEYVSKLPQAVCAHAGASLDGNLYISGGFATDGFQKGVFCYNPDDDKWEPRRNLNSERGLHCMVGFKEHLYVIGGNNKTGGCRKDILLTEIYNLKTDQWTEARPLFEGQSEAGAAVVDGKIYVIGGHNWKERKDVRTVACYDPETNEWEKASEFPEALTSVACCSLVLPNATVAMLTREKEKTKSIDQFDLLMDTDSVEDVIS
ncbi:Oidioi.mRNA.OKI2018_I69.chr2.g8436.t1.cds [Oikopleura dioica]|uniref:Oidioi.mRNA.OKI2018_I69.chr2.g8436.t1.cds n=1 Tax=Oikopleura dioica TaxID=34765 RepID=A0ABN7TFE0_OIKDI|nr:Oidioi.mRNA.OKI2018_I69.chr2.g8436.t1.cds [Oikopleura dioica]